RNQTFQMEIVRRFGVRQSAAKTQIKASFTMALIIGCVINISAFAVSAQGNRGATLLLRQAAAVSPLQKLPSEQQIPELEALARANALLPETVCFPKTLREDGHTVRLAVHRRGSGTNQQALVMIHGVLADHDAWRYLTGDLGTDFDLWLLDLPGCGDSDKPDPDLLGPEGYSPTAIAERVLQALQQSLAARAQPTRLLIVAHSLGGMTALRMMGDPDLRQRYASVLRQIDGMVL